MGVKTSVYVYVDGFVYGSICALKTHRNMRIKILIVLRASAKYERTAWLINCTPKIMFKMRIQRIDRQTRRCGQGAPSMRISTSNVFWNPHWSLGLWASVRGKKRCQPVSVALRKAVAADTQGTGVYPPTPLLTAQGPKSAQVQITARTQDSATQRS